MACGMGVRCSSSCESTSHRGPEIHDEPSILAEGRAGSPANCREGRNNGGMGAGKPNSNKKNHRRHPKVRVLDLFCGAGGAAMGLHRAWPDAEIVGVDINPQPRYPFTFVRADATTYPLESWDFVWASPPCQRFSTLKTAWNSKSNEYPDYILLLRDMFHRYNFPYAIENVPNAPLLNSIRLCGTSFALGIESHELRRHRCVETNFPCAPLPCLHRRPTITVAGHVGWDNRRGKSKSGNRFGLADRRVAMGIDWMNLEELNEAVPPAYSEYVAQQYSARRDNARKQPSMFTPAFMGR